jgi:hypothetical protein
MIPEVIEEAAHKRKRSAIVYSIPDGHVSGSTQQRLFRRGYKPRHFPDYVRKVYNYCKLNKLKPVIEYECDNHFRRVYNHRYEIHVSW